MAHQSTTVQIEALVINIVNIHIILYNVKVPRERNGKEFNCFVIQTARDNICTHVSLPSPVCSRVRSIGRAAASDALLTLSLSSAVRLCNTQQSGAKKRRSFYQ